MTTPQQAQQQLHLARDLEKRATGFSPVWITFVGICGGSAMYAMGQYYAGAATLPLIYLTLAWIIGFLCLVAIFAKIHPTARRGFGKRWGAMMALWTCAWVATVTLPTSLNVAMAEAIAFLILALAGPIWEAVANR